MFALRRLAERQLIIGFQFDFISLTRRRNSISATAQTHERWLQHHMKLPTTFIIILMFAFCTRPALKESAKSSAISAKKATERRNNFVIDTKLEDTWTSFTKAILKHDTKLIATLSADYIFCSDCVTNTSKEKSKFAKFKEGNPEVWYDKLYKDLCYIPAKRFIKDDLLIIFDTSTKLRLL